MAQPAEVPPDVRAGEESLLSAPRHLNLPFNGQVAIIRKAETMKTARILVGVAIALGLVVIASVYQLIRSDPFSSA